MSIASLAPDVPTSVSEKTTLRLSIRTIDNGFILEATKEGPNSKYERVELSFPTLPKLLKAVGTFLKGEKDEGAV